MTIVQPNIPVPPAIELGILAGELYRNGSVVRNVASGRIFKLLDEVPDTGEMLEKVADATARTKWMPSKPVVIITTVAVAAAVATGVVVHQVKKQAQRSMAMPECVKNFSRSWDRYRDAIRDRSLDLEIIDQLIFDFDAVMQYSEGHDSSSTLDLSTKQGESLVDFVADYTSELAEANGVDLSDLQNQESKIPGNDVVVDLRRNLAVQRKIFGDAA